MSTETRYKYYGPVHGALTAKTLEEAIDALVASGLDREEVTREIEEAEAADVPGAQASTIMALAWREADRASWRDIRARMASDIASATDDQLRIWAQPRSAKESWEGWGLGGPVCEESIPAARAELARRGGNP